MFRLFFRALLKLPEAMLVRIVNIGGGLPTSCLDADPRARFHAWFVGTFGRKPTTDPSVARTRHLVSLTLLEGRPLPLSAIQDLVIPGPAGPLRARFYCPYKSATPAPALIFLHFGGCVLGDLETCHTACTYLSHYGEMRVLSVEYRLAPEHKFPSAVEDTVFAFHWLRQNANALGVDIQAIGIGGDSAGGHLAAAASLYLLERSAPLPKLQLLIYPVLEMARNTLPATQFDYCYPLTRADMEWFCHQYLRTTADAADPLCSVIRARQLAGMPPTLLVQAGHDLLFDEGAQFAVRLRTEGVPLHHSIYPTLPHAFTAMSGGLPAARVALIETAKTTGRALSTPGRPFEESLK